jgi:hypothetical protein
VKATGTETFVNCWGFATEENGPESCWTVVEEDGFEQHGKGPAPKLQIRIIDARNAAEDKRKLLAPDERYRPFLAMLLVDVPGWAALDNKRREPRRKTGPTSPNS